MGQRVSRSAAPITPFSPSGAAVLQGRVLSTRLGWFGFLGSSSGVERLTLGHVSADDARAALSTLPDGTIDLSFPMPTIVWEQHFQPDLAERLTRFARGERVDFRGIPTCMIRRSPFQQTVIEQTRLLAYGETVSYMELAARAGSPRAARAVGTIMSQNRLPILIPCHRVVAAGGKIGGYSAPQGIDLKRQLLEMESAAGAG